MIPTFQSVFFIFTCFNFYFCSVDSVNLQFHQIGQVHAISSIASIRLNVSLHQFPHQCQQLLGLWKKANKSLENRIALQFSTPWKDESDVHRLQRLNSKFSVIDSSVASLKQTCKQLAFVPGLSPERPKRSLLAIATFSLGTIIGAFAEHLFAPATANVVQQQLDDQSAVLQNHDHRLFDLEHKVKRLGRQIDQNAELDWLHQIDLLKLSTN